jgi:amidase
LQGNPIGGALAVKAVVGSIRVIRRSVLMTANDTVYLFDISPATPSVMTIESGATIDVEVRGAFDDIHDIAAVPVPFTPACDGHPLAPITGPIRVAGAEMRDSVTVEVLSITPFGEGRNAIMRKFGMLAEDFPAAKIIQCPIRDGKAWFGNRIPIDLQPNLGTISTMPPEGYKPSYAGAYGGDFDQKSAGQAGSIVHLPVLVPGALLFFADPHAAISDGIISGTGVECSVRLEARIILNKRRTVDRPIIETLDTVEIVGWGESVEAASADCARGAVDYVAANTSLSREEAYMLLGIIGELRVGTSPRPTMAARLVIPRAPLRAAGYQG